MSICLNCSFIFYNVEIDCMCHSNTPKKIWRKVLKNCFCVSSSWQFCRVQQRHFAFFQIYICAQFFCGFDTLDRLVDWWGAWERESGIVNMLVNRISVGNTIFSLSKWSEKCLLCIETIKQHAFLRNIFYKKILNEYLISLILNVIDIHVFRYIFLLAWFYHLQNLL